MNTQIKQLKKITIDDIAKELGCSKSTVSRAISGKGRISEEMRKKVLSYSQERGYKPNIIARSLAKSKTYNIGVILPADEDLNEIPFFQNCLLGVCEMALGLGYDVLVTTVDAEDIYGLEEIVEKNKIDGIILTRVLVKDLSVEYLLNKQIPFIVVGSSEYPDVIQIDNHHVEACRELTATLMLKGLKRIGFIGGNLNHVVSQKRYKGFLEALELNQMSVNYNLTYLNCTTKAMVSKAVERILENKADCILCMDDKICTQVLVKLNKEHITIPRDIAVASFYDSLFLQSHQPPITSLKFDEKELGREACKKIVDKLSGKEIKTKEYLGYDMVLRSSTKSNYRK